MDGGPPRARSGASRGAVSIPAACRLETHRKGRAALRALEHRGSQRMRPEATLLHELISVSAHRFANRVALHDNGTDVGYAVLADTVGRFANALGALRVQRADRVAIYLDKR